MLRTADFEWHTVCATLLSKNGNIVPVPLSLSRFPVDNRLKRQAHGTCGQEDRYYWLGFLGLMRCSSIPNSGDMATSLSSPGARKKTTKRA